MTVCRKPRTYHSRDALEVGVLPCRIIRQLGDRWNESVGLDVRLVHLIGKYYFVSMTLVHTHRILWAITLE